MEAKPDYIQDYLVPPTKESWIQMDDEARAFQTEFIPIYGKYAGTKGLLPHLRKYLNTHEIKRKDDFRFTLIIMWCYHIRYYREKRGKEWKAEDVFKIKVPKEILAIK